jgi:hypothetical protein
MAYTFSKKNPYLKPYTKFKYGSVYLSLTIFMTGNIPECSGFFRLGTDRKFHRGGMNDPIIWVYMGDAYIWQYIINTIILKNKFMYNKGTTSGNNFYDIGLQEKLGGQYQTIG